MSRAGGSDQSRVTVLLSIRLGAELAGRVAAADPRLEVLYEPDLLPPRRYPADHRGDPEFRRVAAGEARWRELLGRAEVLYGIPGDPAAGVPADSPKALAALVAGCPRLRWIQATSAGAGEQVQAAGLGPEELARVAVTTASGVHAVPLAEFCVLGLLAVAKDVPGLVADQRSRTWPAVRRPTRELRGETLFILGLGGIGLEVARLAKALGMRTVGFRRTVTEPQPFTDEVHSAGELAGMIDRADALVITLPATPETRGLVDAGTIARMRPGLILVNVGRGAVVDEEALVEALRERRIAGAVLDVFAKEPLPRSSLLWELPNVLVSPHSAALSPHEDERIVELFADNLRRYLGGEPLRNVVRPGVFY
jgi:phosphoglycerate dehydrogenase-like enzyme